MLKNVSELSKKYSCFFFFIFCLTLSVSQVKQINSFISMEQNSIATIFSWFRNTEKFAGGLFKQTSQTNKQTRSCWFYLSEARKYWSEMDDILTCDLSLATNRNPRYCYWYECIVLWVNGDVSWIPRVWDLISYMCSLATVGNVICTM